MRKLVLSALTMMVCLSMPGSVWAKAYLGVSGGWSMMDAGISSVGGGASLEEDDLGFKLFAGVDCSPMMTVEFFYADLGSTELKGNDGDSYVHNGQTCYFLSDGITLKSDVTSYGLAMLWRWPITDDLTAIGKVGYHGWDIDADISPLAGNTCLSDSGSDWLLGVGLQADLTERLAARIEFERYMMDSRDTDFISLGLLIKTP